MPKPWISKTIKGLLHASWILLVSLVGVELILQIFDPLGLDFYSDAAEYFRSHVRYTEYGYYTNRPGDRYILSNAPISINSEGFRGDEFSIKKPPPWGRGRPAAKLFDRSRAEGVFYPSETAL